jgi:hypothetical protein
MNTAGSSSEYSGMPFVQVVERHLKMRSLMAPQDIYKLLFQGVLGPEHLIASAEGFIRRLEQECLSLRPGAGDVLFEPVRPDDLLVRVNLRPYLAAGGHPVHLAEACYETARMSWGTLDDLETVWEQVAGAVRGELLKGPSAAEMNTFSQRLKELGFPPFHHSQTYRDAYHPAYRLAHRDLIKTGVDLP